MELRIGSQTTASPKRVPAAQEQVLRWSELHGVSHERSHHLLLVSHRPSMRAIPCSTMCVLLTKCLSKRKDSSDECEP
eukprot:2568160-Amphidinium_carterae.1